MFAPKLGLKGHYSKLSNQKIDLPITNLPGETFQSFFVPLEKMDPWKIFVKGETLRNNPKTPLPFFSENLKNHFLLARGPAPKNCPNGRSCVSQKPGAPRGKQPPPGGPKEGPLLLQPGIGEGVLPFKICLGAPAHPSGKPNKGRSGENPAITLKKKKRNVFLVFIPTYHFKENFDNHVIHKYNQS